MQMLLTYTQLLPIDFYACKLHCMGLFNFRRNQKITVFTTKLPQEPILKYLLMPLAVFNRQIIYPELRRQQNLERDRDLLWRLSEILVFLQ